MHKNKIKTENKKSAQHIVEFALVVPFFVIIFSMIFPYCASAYKNFRYSYILPKQLTSVIMEQPTNGGSYNFTEIMQNNMHGAMSPYIIKTEQTAYVGGNITTEYKMLFGIRGNSYYSTIVPINKVFVEKTNLNITNTRLTDDFTAYYDSTKTSPEVTGEEEPSDSGEEIVNTDEPTEEGGEDTDDSEETPTSEETPVDNHHNGAPAHGDIHKIKEIIDFFLGGGLW